MSCTTSRVRWVAYQGVDVGISSLQKEVPSVQLHVPVRQLDGGVYQTPRGFLQFSVIQSPDTIFITAFPQYIVISDTLKSFVDKELDKRQKRKEQRK